MLTYYRSRSLFKHFRSSSMAVKASSLYADKEASLSHLARIICY